MVADYESELKIQKFKMADPIWWTKIQKLLDRDDIWYSGILGRKFRNLKWRI